MQEHHLQRAIVTGLIIPTPEVFQIDELDVYNRCYPSEWKVPRQLIHMQRESQSFGHSCIFSECSDFHSHVFVCVLHSLHHGTGYTRL